MSVRDYGVLLAVADDDDDTVTFMHRKNREFQIFAEDVYEFIIKKADATIVWWGDPRELLGVRLTGESSGLVRQWLRRELSAKRYADLLLASLTRARLGQVLTP